MKAPSGSSCSDGRPPGSRSVKRSGGRRSSTRISSKASSAATVSIMRAWIMRASVGVRSNPRARPYSITSSTSGRLSMDSVLRSGSDRGLGRRRLRLHHAMDYSWPGPRRGVPSTEAWSRRRSGQWTFWRAMVTVTAETSLSSSLDDAWVALGRRETYLCFPGHRPARRVQLREDARPRARPAHRRPPGADRHPHGRPRGQERTPRAPLHAARRARHDHRALAPRARPARACACTSPSTTTSPRRSRRSR